MLPRPTVAESAAARAWKCDTSPVSAGLLYLPRVTSIAWRKPRRLIKPILIVRNTAPKISHATTSGQTMFCSLELSQHQMSANSTDATQPLNSPIVRSTVSIQFTDGAAGVVVVSCAAIEPVGIRQGSTAAHARDKVDR